MDRKVITIIGSTRFRNDIKRDAWLLTRYQYLVLFAPFAKEEIPGLEAYRLELETQHFQKIRMANIVLVYNKDGYIGESTLEELNYAVTLEKEIIFLENPQGPKVKTLEDLLS